MYSKIINSGKELAFTGMILSKAMLFLTKYAMCVEMSKYVAIIIICSNSLQGMHVKEIGL